MVERAFLHVNVLCMVAGPFLHGGTCFPACKIDGNCTKNRCLDSVLGVKKTTKKSLTRPNQEIAFLKEKTKKKMRA